MVSSPTQLRPATSGKTSHITLPDLDAGAETMAASARAARVVVVDGLGLRALAAAAYRLTFRRTRLVLRLNQAHAPTGRLHRALLAAADAAIFAPAEPAARPQAPASPPQRIRLACCGDLAPQTTVADLLICAIGWAERYPHRELEISWVGEGDLRGVFAAQPLPDNLSQRFLGRVSPMGLAEILPAIDVVMAPDSAGRPAQAVASALSACIPVIGSLQSEIVRRLIVDRQNGWLFDARQPASLMSALSRALDGFDEMRALLTAARDAAGQREAARGAIDSGADRHGRLPDSAAPAAA